MTAAARLVAAVLLVGAAAPVPAQIWGGGGPPDTSATTRLRPELRLDYIVASRQALHAGVGISAPAGTYVRLGVAAGAGPAWGDSGTTGGETSVSGRLDATVRFLLDPFRRARWGASLGGGLGARYDVNRVRTFVLLLADVEGAGTRGWIPFASLGLGGGVHAALGVRRAAAQGR